MSITTETDHRESPPEANQAQKDATEVDTIDAFEDAVNQYEKKLARLPIEEVVELMTSVIGPTNLGELAEVNRTTVNRWSHKGSKIQPLTAAKLRQWALPIYVLSESGEDIEIIQSWMFGGKRMLSYRTPFECLKEGQIKKVMDVVEYFLSP